MKCPSFLSLVLIVFLVVSCASTRGEAGGASLSSDLPRGTPESVGMDSEALAVLVSGFSIPDAPPLRSLLVLRHDKLVLEGYRDGDDADTLSEMYSATKSVTSLLIGIAIEEGYLKGVDQKVADIFPEVTILGQEDWKRNLTIRDLLTMSSGYDGSSDESIDESTDYAQGFFNLKLLWKPGTHMHYDSGVSHLLSAILQRVVGRKPSDWASEKLFKPMGITRYFWGEDKRGISTGGWGLRLAPRDMAKIGLLVLHGGLWDGKRLVSERWIAESTITHIRSEWNSNYGYQWWIHDYGTWDFGGYRADGWAFQNIIVYPKEDLVVVATGAYMYADNPKPPDIVRDSVVPAIESDRAIRENPGAVRALARAIEGWAKPAAIPSRSGKTAAASISGKVWRTSSLFTSLSLDFTLGRSVAAINLVQNGLASRLLVGLDGAYRVTEARHVGTLPYFPEYDRVALRAHWEDASTLILDWRYVAFPYREEYRFSFAGESMTLRITESCYDPGWMPPLWEISGN